MQFVTIITDHFYNSFLFIVFYDQRLSQKKNEVHSNSFLFTVQIVFNKNVNSMVF